MKKLIVAYRFCRGALVPEDKDALAAFKERLAEGERLRVTFEPFPQKRSDDAFELFHALRDRYASTCGVSRERAKIDFKLHCGVVLPIEHNFHCDRPGQVVELPNGRFVFLVSTNDYSVNEMNRLVQGTLNECLDAQVDISDLMQRMKQ